MKNENKCYFNISAVSPDGRTSQISLWLDQIEDKSKGEDQSFFLYWEDGENKLKLDFYETLSSSMARIATILHCIETDWETTPDEITIIEELQFLTC
jgi:hypothetical protein